MSLCLNSWVKFMLTVYGLIVNFINLYFFVCVIN